MQSEPSGTVIATKCLFESNAAETTGGAISAAGGVELADTIVTSNSAKKGVCACLSQHKFARQRARVLLWSSIPASLVGISCAQDQCLGLGNHQTDPGFPGSQDGGGVHAEMKAVVSGASQILCNRAGGFGGGIAVDAFSTSIADSTVFKSNSAAQCEAMSSGKGVGCKENGMGTFAPV